MKLLALLCLLVLVPGVTWASLIPIGTTLTSSGAFDWAYELRLSRPHNDIEGLPQSVSTIADDTMGVGAFGVSGGYLIIYDFAGYVSGSCSGPIGWACSAQAVDLTLDDAAPFDDPAIENVTWTYPSGHTIPVRGNGLDLGTFTAESIYGNVTQLSYEAGRFKNIAWVGGSGLDRVDRVGKTQGPSSTAIAEPASLALAGLGLVVLLGFSRRSR